MTQPIASVVRIAATPEQAKIFVALLQAEGIPASIDGDSLADEVAVSRRLLNLNGTRVMVPTASLERAREILGAAQVDDAELEAQAIAADAPEREEPSAPPAAVRTNRGPLVLATAAAAVFCVLWLSGAGGPRHPFLRHEPTATGMREFRIADDKLIAEYFDQDGDGAYEEVVAFGDEGQQTAATDEDRNGRWEQIEERRKQGVVCAWSDTDGDGLMDLCVVKDAIGRELQRLRWVDGTGFELPPR